MRLQARIFLKTEASGGLPQAPEAGFSPYFVPVLGKDGIAVRVAEWPEGARLGAETAAWVEVLYPDSAVGEVLVPGRVFAVTLGLRVIGYGSIFGGKA